MELSWALRLAIQEGAKAMEKLLSKRFALIFSVEMLVFEALFDREYHFRRFLKVSGTASFQMKS